jgi:hypothetical protein
MFKLQTEVEWDTEIKSDMLEECSGEVNHVYSQRNVRMKCQSVSVAIAMSTHSMADNLLVKWNGTWTCFSL